jgi:hypothetical protein
MGGSEPSRCIIQVCDVMCKTRPLMQIFKKKRLRRPHVRRLQLRCNPATS